VPFRSRRAFVSSMRGERRLFYALVSPQHETRALAGRTRKVIEMKKLVLSPLILATASSAVFAGPYSGDTVGTASNSAAIEEWADQVDSLTRGPQEIGVANSPPASVGTAASALGAYDSSVVSLGDGGSITLSFALPIANGPGADFSVFENGFASGGAGLAFLELGTVAVSSDGVNFFTFPDVSLTQTTTQVGSFGLLDPTNLYDLAGKTIANVGADFDLSELANISPLLNVNDIQYVKITDVVGSIDPTLGTRDSLGNLINDPFPTNFTSSGFDLNAVAVLNEAPEPGTYALMVFGLVSLIGFARIRRPALVVN